MDPEPSIQGSVYDLPFISRGVSAVFCAVSNSAVIKAPYDTDESRHQLEIERTIYERLGSHPHITRLLSIHDNGGVIVLERLQYPLRKRLWDLRDAGQRAPAQDVLRWALQTTQALGHVHSCGVFQVDIGPHNLLLDWDENVKLSDFAGSSIDGSEPLVLPSVRSEHPRFPSTTPSIRSEIFALGSILYEMETARQPYHDKQEHEVETLFNAGTFPDTGGLVLGEVISKCWAMKYTNAGEVANDIRRIQERLKIVDDLAANEGEECRKGP